MHNDLRPADKRPLGNGTAAPGEALHVAIGRGVGPEADGRPHTELALGGPQQCGHVWRSASGNFKAHWRSVWRRLAKLSALTSGRRLRGSKQPTGGCSPNSRSRARIGEVIHNELLPADRRHLGDRHGGAWRSTPRCHWPWGCGGSRRRQAAVRLAFTPISRLAARSSEAMYGRQSPPPPSSPGYSLLMPLAGCFLGVLGDHSPSQGAWFTESTGPRPHEGVLGGVGHGKVHYLLELWDQLRAFASARL